MLVTQLRFQDPLNPMEHTEFSAQLAQFSSLEQLQNIGGKLDNALEVDMMLARSINNTMATTLIGKTVRALDSQVSFDGRNAVDISVELSGRASQVNLEIIDSEGKTVRTLTESNLDSGDQSIRWDGKDTRGRIVPAGDYYIRASGTAAGGSKVNVTPLALGRVDGVKFIDGNPVLIVNGREIPFGAVLSIAEHQNGLRNISER